MCGFDTRELKAHGSSGTDRNGKVIVLRVAVDLGSSSRLSLGVMNDVRCLSVDKYKTAV